MIGYGSTMVMREIEYIRPSPLRFVIHLLAGPSRCSFNRLVSTVLSFLRTGLRNMKWLIYFRETALSEFSVWLTLGNTKEQELTEGSCSAGYHHRHYRSCYGLAHHQLVGRGID